MGEYGCVLLCSHIFIPFWQKYCKEFLPKQQQKLERKKKERRGHAYDLFASRMCMRDAPFHHQTKGLHTEIELSYKTINLLHM